MACLLLCVTILTAVEILLAAISEDIRNTNNNSTDSRKVTLSSVQYLHSLWGRDLAVFILLHCVWTCFFWSSGMFIWCLAPCIASCSNAALISSATAHIRCWAKKKMLSSEEAEKIWTMDEAVMDLESKCSCLIPVLRLHRGANLPGSDGDHDAAATSPLLQAPAPREGWDVPALPCLPSWRCLCSHTRAPFRNRSSDSHLMKSKNETVQTPLQRHLCEIYVYKKIYI